jgi:hypothetical protein
MHHAVINTVKYTGHTQATSPITICRRELLKGSLSNGHRQLTLLSFHAHKKIDPIKGPKETTNATQ